MITGGSCPHPLYRITGVSPRRRAATADLAEALGAGVAPVDSEDAQTYAAVTMANTRARMSSSFPSDMGV